MSSFVHVDQPSSHPGVVRAEKVIDYVQSQSSQFQGTRGLSAVLLAAVVAALMAVADKVVTEWTDGSLMAAWMVMWLIAFVGLALFAGVARSTAARGMQVWQGIQRKQALARADAQMLDAARHDPRVMNDLKAAMSRTETWEPTAIAKARQMADVPMPTMYEAMRRLNSSRYY